MRKLVLIQLCSLYVLSVILAILFLFVGKKVCISNRCKRVSLMIQERIDDKVNPCDNFYYFACGKIISKNDTRYHNSILFETIVNQLTKLYFIFEETSQKNEPKAFQTVKQFYKLCKSEETFTSQVDQLRTLFKKVGGFPALEGEEWNKNNTWTWLNTMKKIRNTGLSTSSLFSIDISPNPKNTSIFIPVISHPVISSPSGHLDKTLVTLGADPEIAAKDSKDMLALSSQLSTLMVKYPIPTTITGLYNCTRTLAELSSAYDFINWSEYLKIILKIENSDLDGNINIIIANEEYLRNLKKVFEDTPVRVLANYMMNSILVDLNYLSVNARTEGSCRLIIYQRLPLLAQIMYVNKYPDSSYTSVLTEMVAKIRRELLASVNSVDWMDFVTRQEAIAKVENMADRLGYPPEFLDMNFIKKYYEKLSINGNMLESMLSIIKLSADNNYSWCFKPINKKKWTLLFLLGAPVYIPNAFYATLENSINIIVGILQNPIFDADWPKYINYGRLGSIIGHEMTHALDTEGCHMDKDGQVRDWWKASTFAQFTNKAQCFIDQYDKFTFFNGTGMQNLPGKLEVGEAIADAGGVKCSFRAYRDYSRAQLWHEPLLPQLDYTQEQLFFLSFAHFYCYTYSSDEYVKIHSDVHPPHYYRVFGTLQNTQYFKEVFGCPLGSPQAPKKTCEIW